MVEARLRLTEAEIYAGQLEAAELELVNARHDAAALGGWHAGDLADVEAQLASARGQLQIRLEAFERSAEGYALVGDLRRESNARLNLADLRNRVGDYGGAVDALSAALTSCQKVGNRLAEGYALLNLGYARGARGQRSDALATLEEAAVLARSSDDARLEEFCKLYALRISARSSRASAESLLDEAVALVSREGASGTVRALGRAIAARLALRLHRHDEALEHSQEAIEELRRLGGLEEDEMEVYLAHGLVLHALGEDERARQVVTEGLARLREVAASVVDAELRRSFHERVDAHLEIRGLAGELGLPVGELLGS